MNNVTDGAVWLAVSIALAIALRIGVILIRSTRSELSATAAGAFLAGLAAGASVVAAA